MTGSTGCRSRSAFSPGRFKEIVVGVSRGRQRAGVQTGSRQIGAGDVTAGHMTIGTGQRRAAIPVTAVSRNVTTVGTGLIRIELRNLAARYHDRQSAVIVARQMSRS